MIMSELLGGVFGLMLFLYTAYWMFWPIKEKPVVECKHQWRAKSFGKRDENTGKYLGRACVCMRCNKEELFIEPPNGIINW
jgi:hypothetical protein